jgi:hypothetical protein
MHGLNQHILYNHTNGFLYYDQDGSGSTYAPVHFATLTTHPVLTHVDFLVVPYTPEFSSRASIASRMTIASVAAGFAVLPIYKSRRSRIIEVTRLRPLSLLFPRNPA